MPALSKIFPGLIWLQSYTRSNFVGDFWSGIIIAAMLVPQSIGYAIVAGLPPEYGLYACIFPPVVYALLGTSNKISMGPVALDAILIITGLSVIAEPGSDQYLELAIVLTLLVALIQLFFGMIKFGFIANFLSYPVILGYSGAAAIIIIGTQVEQILGVSISGNNMFVSVWEFIGQFEQWHWASVAVGLVGIMVMIFPKMLFPGIPWGLILLVVGMVVSGLWDFQAAGVDVIAYVPQGLPAPQMPHISIEQIVALLPTAFTVALMGYVGTMSICKAQEKPTDTINVNPNQELKAVGAANLVGAFFSAFPVSASFSRSAAFVESGAATQVSALVSSAVIVITMLYLTPYFSSYPLPTALLAAIIIISVSSLFKYQKMKSLLKQNKHEFLLMLITFLITLSIGVQQGLLTGIVLSIAKVIYNTANPHMTELGAIQGGKLFRNVNRFDQVTVREDILIFRFDAPLYFANKDYFVEKLYRWISAREKGRLKSVIFDAEAVSTIDCTAIMMLEKVIEQLGQQNIKLYISNTIGPVRDALYQSSLHSYMSKDTMFSTIQDAVDYIDHGVNRDERIALQTNL